MKKFFIEKVETYLMTQLSIKPEEQLFITLLMPKVGQ